MTKRQKKLKRTFKGIIFIMIAICLFIGGFYYIYKAKPSPTTKTEKETQVIKEQKEVIVEPKKLNIVNLDSKSRPYAIMINNINKARQYQSGLQDAYLVYEIIVEGGITRFMALFFDQNTARIGSIRSARHYFLDYALENDAIYVHHGQSPQAANDFRKLKVDRIEVSNVTGWRDRTLRTASEHTLFTNIAKLNKGLKSKRLERKKAFLLDYSIDEIDLSKNENALLANKVLINYSNVIKNSYTYDESTKTYLRSVNGQPQNDYVTKKQYHFKNIIVYQVENYLLNDPEHKGRQGLNNIGKGTGYFITNGYATRITWEKKDRNTKTIYRLENGDILKVNDGNTFIQIQPKGQLLEIS